MKRTLLIIGAVLCTTSLSAQTQIGNSDMEQWEPVNGGNEPVNWNSFLSASGTWSSFAGDQCEESSDVRPGSAGTSSARIWVRDAGLAYANGNLTVGQINMGSTSPSGSENYNISRTADADLSESLTVTPDSVVFWVKYNATNATDSARMKATLHDNFDYRDPEDGTSASHVVATAVLNYAPTGGWVRMSVPFDYSGPASGNTHILITFTTNKTPGAGTVSPADEVFIDDVELIYNQNSLDEESLENVIAIYNSSTNILNVSSELGYDGQYAIYNQAGQLIQEGSL